MVWSSENRQGKVDACMRDDALSTGGGDMSKGCKTYAVDLSAYFDGELEGEAAERMEAHLSGCQGCTEALERLGKLRSALHTLSRPSRPGRSILSDLKARMAQERGESKGDDETLVS